MVSDQKPTFPVRTAVLAIHGMGIQRPLDTVRGIVNAVWSSVYRQSKFWMHPERSTIDIDLPVITTDEIPNVRPDRCVDFHEFYWSHLMSETRATAVLLWLFELARKGPPPKTNMKLVWASGALFLVLVILSVSLLVLKTIERLSDVQTQNGSILLAPALMFLIFFILSTIVFFWNRAWVFVGLSIVLAGVCLALLRLDPVHSSLVVEKLLPALVALVATLVALGLKWGIRVFAAAYVLSFMFELLVHNFLPGSLAATSWAELLPWAMTSSWCIVAACVILATYLVLSAVFLQPYLGDAARYFRNDPSNVAVRREIRRQAVDTLAALHRSQRYDRIVVVAHSLGTVIAYDMLRTYFGRLARSLPTDEGTLPEMIAKVDHGTLSARDLRAGGREIVREIARVSRDDPSKAWLVTDFVTLGSPLTHAHYLMCHGKSSKALAEDFSRRVQEREFPTCPPVMIDGDGMLTYAYKPKSDADKLESEDKPKRYFHIAALFGLTRWTNLYFPVAELFSGDAIGGPLGDVFGLDIYDVAVTPTRPTTHKLSARITSWIESVLAHVTYWTVPPGSPNAPHLVALRNAIDLADTGIVNDPKNFDPKNFDPKNFA